MADVDVAGIDGTDDDDDEGDAVVADVDVADDVATVNLGTSGTFATVFALVVCDFCGVGAADLWLAIFNRAFELI